MTFSDYPSKLLENAVNEFASLPGIGKKTAFRLVMHLLRQKESDVERFGESIVKLKKEIKYCKICFNISDNDVCDICSDNSRDRSLMCIVENIRDVIAIEKTGQYRGVYHVLGGIISPMDGIGPSDLNIDPLEEKVKAGNISEVIFALSTTMEGDTTNYYIYRRLMPYNIKITSLSRGVAIGDELEYTDEITLGRSIVNRMPFELQK
ncbi:MAG: recombination mediator RecR [Bacteroidales bacterium]|jgi:recombination protein RecR|nr:recombination mediator RecR [Bacteroidales bacterium]